MAQTEAIPLVEGSFFDFNDPLFSELTLEEIRPDLATISRSLIEGAQGFVLFCEAPCDLASETDPKVFETRTEKNFLDFHRQRPGKDLSLKHSTKYLFSIAAMGQVG